MNLPPLDARRYRAIRDAAGLTLIAHSDGKMPVTPRALFERMGFCRVVAYSQYERQNLAPHSLKAVDFFGTQDACTVYECRAGRYLVLYDDESALRAPGRLRWTLAHEMGHIVLGHLRDHAETRCGLDGLPEAQYHCLEREADYFAAMLLAYPVVIRACGIASAAQLQGFCGLSQPAARAQFEKLLKSRMMPSEVDAQVERHFEEEIRGRKTTGEGETDWGRYGR